MSSSLPLLLLASLALVSGCSESTARSADDTDSADNPMDNNEDTDETDPETTYSGPSFWSLNGSLNLVDGLPSLEGSSLQVAFFDSRGQPWQEDETDVWTCDVSLVEAIDGPLDAADGETLFGWWQVTVDAPEEAPCPWSIPTPEAVGDTELSQVIIGFGDFDARLQPSMQAAGLDAELDVYGLYTLHPGASGDTVYVFGVAGTEGQFAGEDASVSAPPLPAGRYDLQTLVLLPVPEATQQ